MKVSKEFREQVREDLKTPVSDFKATIPYLVKRRNNKINTDPDKLLIKLISTS